MGSNEFSEYFVRVYENALLMLDVFGGCAISYEELSDKNETSWADALASATSFSANDLLGHRSERLKQGADGFTASNMGAILEYPRASLVEEKLRHLKGSFIPASPQIRRKWAG